MISKYIIAYSLIVTFLVMFVSVSYVYGALEEGYCVDAEVSDISPSSMNVGDDFTVGIHIENCGQEVPENVTFEILSLPVDITVKEPMIVTVPKLQYATSERFLTYHFSTSDSIEPGTYVIRYKITYGHELFSEYKEDEISIRILGSRAELDIASVKYDPVLPYQGDTVELTLRIENFGDGTANSVRVFADHPFKGLKESFIGTLDSNEDGPVVFTFIADKSGEFAIPVRISFRDDFGDRQMDTDINIIILERETDYLSMAGSVAVILIFAVLIFWYFRTKKQKEKVIRQLLREERKEIRNHKKK